MIDKFRKWLIKKLGGYMFVFITYDVRRGATSKMQYYAYGDVDVYKFKTIDDSWVKFDTKTETLTYKSRVYKPDMSTFKLCLRCRKIIDNIGDHFNCDPVAQLQEKK